MESSVLVLRADSLRHKALASHLCQKNIVTNEIVVQINENNTNKKESGLTFSHLAARQQSEKDFFQNSVDSFHQPKTTVFTKNDINNKNLVDYAKGIRAEYLIVFGTPILKDVWLEAFPHKILGVHLGLSPYYRGSGTNFFPFVNKDLGAVGYTLMQLNEGVDTGAIVHQESATVVLGDSIHSIGNRVISSMFKTIDRIVLNRVNLESSVPQTQYPSKIYKKRDFTETSLIQAYRNLKEGLIEDFIHNEHVYRRNFPLVQNPELL